MGNIGLGLSYVLPSTEFAIDVVTRSEVRSRAASHYLETVADVQVTTTAVADLAYRQLLTVDAGLLEKISLVVSLDDRGFITAVNSEAGRDISPVVSLLGKAVSLAAAVVLLGVPMTDGDTDTAPSLEDEWDAKYPRLVVLRAALTDQVERLVNAMANGTTSVEELHALGSATEAVQNQLAIVSEARRAWIAGRTVSGSKDSWRLKPADLYRVEEPTLPDVLEPSTGRLSAPMKDMCNKYSVFVAIADPDRAARKTRNVAMDTDQIALRRCRSVAVGVYTNDPKAGWTLDRGGIRFLDIVDDYSPTDPLSIDGSWWRMKKFEISYHADMSIKSFGVSSTSSVSAIATSTGEVLDALTQARKDRAASPTDADKELAKAKTQLELLQSASEYEILAEPRTGLPNWRSSSSKRSSERRPCSTGPAVVASYAAGSSARSAAPASRTATRSGAPAPEFR